MLIAPFSLLWARAVVGSVTRRWLFWPVAECSFCFLAAWLSSVGGAVRSCANVFPISLGRSVPCWGACGELLALATEAAGLALRALGAGERGVFKPPGLEAK